MEKDKVIRIRWAIGIIAIVVILITFGQAIGLYGLDEVTLRTVWNSAGGLIVAMVVLLIVCAIPWERLYISRGEQK